MNRIILVFGTRPEFIKLFTVIKELKKIRNLDLILINANQQPDLIQPLLKQFTISAHYTLNCPMSCDLAASIGELTKQLDAVIRTICTEKPVDFIIAQGDTNTVFAASMAGKYNSVKFAHVEAGLRSFSDHDPFPEEMNRKLVGANSYVHFAPEKNAVKNLQQEGIRKECIVLSGNTVIDFCKLYSKKGAKRRNTVLITQHRRNKKGYNINKILDECLSLALAHPQLNFIWIGHPSQANFKIENLTVSNFNFVSPLDPLKLLEIYAKTAVIITDSGGVQEEGIYHGIPVIITRNYTERQVGVLKKRSFLAGSNGEFIEPLFEMVMKKWSYKPSYIFGKGDASVRIRKWFEDYFNAKVVHDVAFLGFGPAGSGVIINMLQRNELYRLKKKKVLVLESSDAILKGHISKYGINSDTYARTFVEFSEVMKNSMAKKLLAKRSYKKLSSINGNVPLREVDEFLQDASVLFEKFIKAFPNIDIHCNEKVQSVIRINDDLFKIRTISRKNGSIKEQEYYTKKIVTACGGHQDKNAILNSRMGNSSLKPETFAFKVVFTHDLFLGKNDTVLRSLKNPKVLIIGSSHSAFTSAIYLRRLLKNNCEVTMLYRSMPKPFFLTLEEAHANGFTDYTADDTCLLTGRVNRLSGLRFEAKDLLLDLLNKRPSNIQMMPIPKEEELRHLLEEADYIIPAFGYIHNVPQIADQNGEELKLNLGPGKRFVNDQCQALDSNGVVVKNIFAIGLASGFVPSGKLGGEKNFRGQTNGYWLYQNGVGEIIADQIF